MKEKLVVIRNPASTIAEQQPSDHRSRMSLRIVVFASLFLCLAVGLGAQGYRRAEPGYVFEFPRDHGAHPDFRIEWWYLTGNLRADDGRTFGYQWTMFRNRLVPPGDAVAESPLAPVQVYLGHFGFSNIATQRHRGWEQVARPGLGQASASDATLDLALRDWSLKLNDDGTMSVRAREDDVAIDLTLTVTKPLVIHGEDGVHVKSEDASQASHYLSFTRLQSRGTVTVGGETIPVTGSTWMDHEFGSTWLGGDEAGWDWFALQLDTGDDLMLYRLRRQDGTAVPIASGTWVDAQGNAQPLKKGDYTIEPLEYWTSLTTGAKYPTTWRVRVESLDADLRVEAAIPDQEMRMTRFTGTNYYEGAVSASGAENGAATSGVGYMELVGYSEAIRGLR